jgi:hypothetical protein
MLAKELRVNWLPKGWSQEKELSGDLDEPRFQPDSQESADAATADGQRIDKAEAVWSNLQASQQQVLLEAAEILSDPGTSQDVRHLLGWDANEGYAAGKIHSIPE